MARDGNVREGVEGGGWSGGSAKPPRVRMPVIMVNSTGCSCRRRLHLQIQQTQHPLLTSGDTRWAHGAHMFMQTTTHTHKMK